MNEQQAETLRNQLQRYIRRHRRERPQTAGLTEVPIRILGVLARARAPLSPSQIGERAGQASSNVAAALRELETGGYVDREPDRLDKRRVSVTLTELGWAAVVKHRATRTHWLQDAATAVLSREEQATLLAAGELLERLAAWDGTGARHHE